MFAAMYPPVSTIAGYCSAFAILIPEVAAFLLKESASASFLFCNASCSYSSIVFSENFLSNSVTSVCITVVSGSPIIRSIFTLATFRLFCASKRVSSILDVCNSDFNRSFLASNPFFSNLAKTESWCLDCSKFSFITSTVTPALYRFT